MYDFPELWDEQGPLPSAYSEGDDTKEASSEDDTSRRKVGGLDPSKLGNSPNRKKLDTMSEKIEEVIKKNQAKDRMHSQMNGPQRIENSFCDFEEMNAGKFNCT